MSQQANFQNFLTKVGRIGLSDIILTNILHRGVYELLCY